MPASTYYDSATDTRISRTRAIREVSSHGSDPSAFLREVQPDESNTYDAQEVLRWLGY